MDAIAVTLASGGSGGRCELAGSTNDSSNRVTGRRWRRSGKPFMIKDTMLPRSLEVS
jgi:hypothetical protein